jgi:hypothetical protein
MPLFILAGGELVLLFLGARIAWWIVRTRESDAAPAARAPGGGPSVAHVARARRAGAVSGSETLREAA